MRAVCIKSFGGLENVTVQDIPAPVPGTGEALVRIRAAALNHLDLHVIKGRPGLELKGAHVLGSDAAGTLEALGPGCEEPGLQPGAAVLIAPGVSCMRCEHCLRGEHSECVQFRILGFQLPGVFGEFAIVPARNLFPKPAYLSWEEAAAMPLAHLTAWHMLFSRAHLVPGETVLIHGIGGGVAQAALQLCLLQGAQVLVTSSSDAKLARAQQLGAAAGFNYRTTLDLPSAIRTATNGHGVDLVFDNAGAATLPLSMAVVRRGGRIVTCGVTSGTEVQINLRHLYWNHISLLGSTMGTLEDMRRMVRLAERTQLRPVLDRSFALAEAPLALKRMQAGEQTGKIVLTVGEGA